MYPTTRPIEQVHQEGSFGATIKSMIILSLFQWWYGAGWLSAIKHGEKRLQDAYRLFSIPILLRTLFAPWRRIITAPRAGFGAYFRAGIDNTISRVIGFFVRFIVLITAGIVLFFAAVISLVELLIWPFIPLAAVVFVFMGVLG